MPDRMAREFVFVAACLILTWLWASPVLANPVSGPCANCHTMHNSQNGVEVDNGGPYDNLLKTDCLGCHSANDGSTSVSSIGAPIVYNTAEPTYGNKYMDGPNQGLAAGNFYYVENVGDNRGHNVMFSNPDDVLSRAPTQYPVACGAGSCHENLNEVYTGGSKPEFHGVQGCTKCHMLMGYEMTFPTDYPKSFHHLPQNPGAGKERYAGKYATGGKWVMNWYRHLAAPHTSNRAAGVIGLEDPDWELTFSANDHNDYREVTLSNPGRPLSDDTLSGFCAGCHMYFCANTVENYVRHPAFAAIIPNTSEFANAFGAEHTYDPLVPVGQPNISSLQPPKQNVTLGEDRVMCLSCHRAHGSPYPDMLRFDPDDMQAGGGAGDGEGCFKCHTEKDGS